MISRKLFPLVALGVLLLSSAAFADTITLVPTSNNAVFNAVTGGVSQTNPNRQFWGRVRRGSPSNFEYTIGNSTTGGPGTPQGQNGGFGNVTFVSGGAQSFSLAYNAGMGLLSLTVGGGAITQVNVGNSGVGQIEFQVRLTEASSQTVTLSNMTITGGGGTDTVNDLTISNDLRYFSLNSALFTTSFMLSGNLTFGGTLGTSQERPSIDFAANNAPTVATPEPATMLLLGTGLAGVAARVRRRRKNGEGDDKA